MEITKAGKFFPGFLIQCIIIFLPYGFKPQLQKAYGKFI